MKLRSYLMITNGVSIGFILLSFLFSYQKMLLSLEQIIWLSTIAILVGGISFVAHIAMTRPIEKAINVISDESKKIANGLFEGKVPQTGFAEFRELAANFNEMSTKLDESFTRLYQSEASRKELVANISHDLRTPMASIQSFVEALQDDVIKDKVTFDRYLHTIQLETKQLSLLIDDLFQLSQLESGVENIKQEPYFVDNLIVETLQSCFLQMRDKEIDISIDMDENTPKVWISPDKIKRVIVNLVQNAMQYSHSGCNIKIASFKQSNNFLKIVVTDDGDEIPAEELPRIFDRFYRIDKSRNRSQGGLGLGLSIAKSIIELHKGEIGVTSNRENGNSFWFTLPIYKEKF